MAKRRSHGARPGARRVRYTGQPTQELRSELGDKYNLLESWLGSAAVTEYIKCNGGPEGVLTNFPRLMRATVRRKLGDEIGLFIIEKMDFGQITSLVQKWHGVANFKEAWEHYKRQPNNAPDVILQNLVDEKAWFTRGEPPEPKVYGPPGWR